MYYGYHNYFYYRMSVCRMYVGTEARLSPLRTRARGWPCIFLTFLYKSFLKFFVNEYRTTRMYGRQTQAFRCVQWLPDRAPCRVRAVACARNRDVPIRVALQPAYSRAAAITLWQLVYSL